MIAQKCFSLSRMALMTIGRPAQLLKLKPQVIWPAVKRIAMSMSPPITVLAVMRLSNAHKEATAVVLGAMLDMIVRSPALMPTVEM